MTRTSVPRVYLGNPYNREFWWNTALRILNERHRGQFDSRFTRRQNLPDAAGIHKSQPSAYMVGGVGVSHVALRQCLNYKRSTPNV